jgi:hypothetical protein
MAGIVTAAPRNGAADGHRAESFSAQTLIVVVGTNEHGRGD